MNVLVLAPHPDDEAIGCGGTLVLHKKRGDLVTTVFLTSGELGLKHLAKEKAWNIREQEAKKAAKVLGLHSYFFLRGSDWMLGDEITKAANLLRPILKKFKPALIYLPHPQEWHPDHKAALPILSAALRRSGLRSPELRGYEVWTPLAEHTHVEDISSVMAVKMKSLKAYASQLKEFDYAWAISGLNQYRGVIAARKRYAEVFLSLSVAK
jgi:N-acetylglucosamine malate deacetylase 1